MFVVSVICFTVLFDGGGDVNEDIDEKDNDSGNFVSVFGDVIFVVGEEDEFGNDADADADAEAVKDDG